MKKSVSIHLTLMASMALVSCGRSRRCADPAGQVVPDAMCVGPVIAPGYHWIYAGGRSMTRFSTGPRGSSAPSEGVSRGGFGAHGEAHASGSSSGHAAGSGS